MTSDGRRRLGGGRRRRRIDDGTIDDPVEAEVTLNQRRSARNVTHLEILVMFRLQLRLGGRPKGHLTRKSGSEVIV